MSDDPALGNDTEWPPGPVPDVAHMLTVIRDAHVHGRTPTRAEAFWLEVLVIAAYQAIEADRAAEAVTPPDGE